MNETLEAIKSNLTAIIKNTPYSAAVLVVFGLIVGVVFYALLG